MTASPIVVLADDLTGAAEICAIGRDHGLNAVVALSTESLPRHVSLIVFDTDSRLNTPDEAARKVRHIIEHLPAGWNQRVFKKVDSVLRGPVVVELETAASALGADRVLLAPANPSLGRKILNALYSVDGVPLDKTAFARDPHHPAHSAHVAALLGPTSALPLVLARPGMPLPSLGVIVAEASSATDVAHWATRLQPGTLPAGGADFFQAYLESLGFKKELTPPSVLTVPSGPNLIISGTTSTAGENLLQTARQSGLPIFPIPPALLNAGESFETIVKTWADHIRRALVTHNIALAVVDQPLSDSPQISSAIRRAFARMATLLEQHRAFHHLLVDGGATAAAVTRSLAWHQLSTAAVWAPGVVSLQPLSAPDVLLTLKPGSYSWPAPLWEKLLARSTPAASAVTPSS
jgi:uncharacterized protein YgbK (DUF1537 family)